jgi:nucleoid-associated protein YgaU
MRLEKAYIEVTAGARKDAQFPVLFNPAEYSLERANAYKATPVPGLGSPLIQFVNGDATTLTMDLFLDDLTDPNGPPGPSGSSSGPMKPVAQRINEIVGLLDIDATLHAPPPVRFMWGPLRFDAVFEKIGRKILLFRPDGTPARATLACSFREFRPLVQQLDEPRRESADKTKRRQISAADTIWLIGDREYGDIRLWRAIADASDVDDPRLLKPGDWLRLPMLEDGDGLRGSLQR